LNISDKEQKIINSKLFGNYINLLNNKAVSIKQGFALQKEEYYLLEPVL